MFVFVVTLLSAIGGFLFGYDTGIVSGAMVFVKDDFNLDDIWQEIIVSITIVGAWLFSLIAGYIADMFGRKPSILLASVVFTVGSVILGVAPVSPTGKWVLFVGRFIVGAGVGLASMTVPMYIAEVAPTKIRGSLSTLNSCFIAGGQLVASVVAGAFSYDTTDGWRWMLGLAGVPSAIQFIGFMFMPESPRWLVKTGKVDRAREVLRKIRPATTNVERELKSVVKDCASAERQQQAALERSDSRFAGSVWVRVFTSKGVRR